MNYNNFSSLDKQISKITNFPDKRTKNSNSCYDLPKLSAQNKYNNTNGSMSLKNAFSTFNVCVCNKNILKGGHSKKLLRKNMSSGELTKYAEEF